MGTSSLKAGMHIQLERLDYHPGETIVGSVYISLEENLESGSLLLNFKGLEKTKWSEGSGDNRRTYKKTLETYNFENMIYDWPDGLLASHFEIPFTFRLPEDLPGSFCRTEGVTAVIEYDLIVKLIANKDRNSTAETKIIIKQVVQPSEFQVNLAEQITKDFSVCCKKKGQCTIRHSIPKNIFYLTEIIEILAEVDNSENSLEIRDVEASLVQELFVQSKRHSKTFEFPIMKMAGHGLQREKSNFNFMINLQVALNGILGQLSCSGNIVACQYYVKVVANFQSWYIRLGKKPTSSIPITLITPFVSAPSPPPPPPGWNPQAMNGVALEYDQRMDSRHQQVPFFLND